MATGEKSFNLPPPLRSHTPGEDHTSSYGGERRHLFRHDGKIRHGSAHQATSDEIRHIEPSAVRAEFRPGSIRQDLMHPNFARQDFIRPDHDHHDDRTADINFGTFRRTRLENPPQIQQRNVTHSAYADSVRHGSARHDLIRHESANVDGIRRYPENLAGEDPQVRHGMIRHDGSAHHGSARHHPHSALVGLGAPPLIPIPEHLVHSDPPIHTHIHRHPTESRMHLLDKENVPPPVGLPDSLKPPLTSATMNNDTIYTSTPLIPYDVATPSYTSDTGAYYTGRPPTNTQEYDEKMASVHLRRKHEGKLPESTVTYDLITMDETECIPAPIYSHYEAGPFRRPDGFFKAETHSDKAPLSEVKRVNYTYDMPKEENTRRKEATSSVLPSTATKISQPVVNDTVVTAAMEQLKTLTDLSMSLKEEMVTLRHENSQLCGENLNLRKQVCHLPASPESTDSESKTKTLPLPSYKEGQSWQNFVIRFNDWTSRYRIPKQKWLGSLRQAIPDSAQRLIRKIKDYDVALTKVQEHYEPKLHFRRAEQAWLDIKQNPKESFDELLTRIEELGEKYHLLDCYTENNVERVLITRFVSAIRNPQTKQYLEQLLTDEDHEISLEKLVHRAKNFEQIDTSDKSAKVLAATETNPALTKLEAELKEARKMINQLQQQMKQTTVSHPPQNNNNNSQKKNKNSFNKNQQSNRQQFKFPGKCYTCQEVGHKHWNCPQKNASTQQSSLN